MNSEFQEQEKEIKDKIILLKKTIRKREMLDKMLEVARLFNLSKKDFREFGDGQFAVTIPTIDKEFKLEMVLNENGELIKFGKKETFQSDFTTYKNSEGYSQIGIL